MSCFKFVIVAGFSGLLATPALSAGGDSPTPPKPVVKECKKNKIWSDKKGRCVRPENAGLSDDALYNTVRSLAYAGQLDTAQQVLMTMSDQTDDRVLTYWGFTHRKLGNQDLGMTYYSKALKQNPDNLLTRSYLGQAHVEAGRFDLARLQLTEIRARGGQDSWPEVALATALQTGSLFSY